MTQVLYSVNSHRKIVHMTNCRIIQRIPKQNRKTFDSFEEAYEQGYRHCNCCSVIAQKYRKEKKAVDSFCRQHQLHFELINGVIHVISRHDCWRIIVNGKKNILFLYHKNTHWNKNKKIPSIIPGYHSQAYRTDSILGYLEYIVKHDNYRDEHTYDKYNNHSDNSSNQVSELWVIEKYGKPWDPNDSIGYYRRIKGTKKYRKEEKRKKRQKRKAEINRVCALIEELNVMHV